MSVANEERLRALSSAAPWVLGLLFLSVLFWKLRIFDAATSADMTLGAFDIYTEHYPMTRYGFEELSSGRIPHWNPYQLGGMPFLAVPHVGLLYPGNWIYALFDTAAATELSYVLHLFWGGLGCMLLWRTLGLSWLAGLAAALTFMWSGWMGFYANQASLVSGMSWLPMTIYLIERTLRGNRLAGIGVALAVGCQLLNGATEFFVHNMYASGAWSALRLAQLGLGGEWRTAFWRGAGLLGAVVAGVGLALPQLLPSLELAASSVRGESALTIEQAIGFDGAIAPADFFEQALRATGMVTVGVLPLAGLLLGFGTRWRPLWALLVAIGGLAMLLSFGGSVYAWYFDTPFGGLFRRPHKFLHLYAFAQSGLAALGVAWLEAHVATGRAALWRRAPWGAALGLLVGAGLWLALRPGFGPGLLALTAGLVVFGSLAPGRGRRGLIVGLVVVQGVVLFLGVEQRYLRPAARPEALDAYPELVSQLSRSARSDRVHIEPDIYMLPALMQKAGTLHRLRVIGDYEPLVSQRAADYFRRVAPPRHPDQPFTGSLHLSRGSRWQLMDLAAVRFYVVRGGSSTDRALAEMVEWSDAASVRLVDGQGFPRIYEREALARVRFVSGARAFEAAEELLDALVAADFDPTREVLLEGDPADLLGDRSRSRSAGGSGRGSATVEVAVDEPERMVVRVTASAAGWLVVADAWHPRWRATVNGVEMPVLPANHLFRAVEVDAGESEVELRFLPAPFRAGLAVSAASGVVLATLGIAWCRERRPDDGAIG